MLDKLLLFTRRAQVSRTCDGWAHIPLAYMQCAALDICTSYYRPLAVSLAGQGLVSTKSMLAWTWLRLLFKDLLLNAGLRLTSLKHYRNPQPRIEREPTQALSAHCASSSAPQKVKEELKLSSWVNAFCQTQNRTPFQSCTANYASGSSSSPGDRCKCLTGPGSLSITIMGRRPGHIGSSHHRKQLQTLLHRHLSRR